MLALFALFCKDCGLILTTTKGMMMRTRMILLLMFCLLAPLAMGKTLKSIKSKKPAPAPKVDMKILSTLVKGHPRLLMSNARLAELKALAKTDAFLKRLADTAIANADGLQNRPVETYRIPDGKRLLGVSRNVLSRVSQLAFAARWTGETKYIKRTVAEMEAVCKFKDWNPSHFLDTAEMTAALAIGYDWLYDKLTPAQRKTIREGIVRLGLLPGQKVYRGGGWWSKASNNWNQVCNGGMTMGALAVAEDEPKLAAEIITAAIKSVPIAMNAYGPEGGYAEGPSYWHYGTMFNCLMIDSLQTVLGSDFGLTKIKSFAQSVHYHRATISPTGGVFNYPDCGSRVALSPEVFFFSRTWNLPSVAGWYRNRLAGKFDLKQKIRLAKVDRNFVMNIAWYDPRGKADADEGLRLDVFTGRQPVALMRSGEKTTDWFLGIKGGDNRSNHAHMDIGSFVLDWGGHRWAIDLGSDNYNLPGYFHFNGKRWNYLRLNSLGHNTLAIDGKLQQGRSGVCKLTSKAKTPTTTAATFDISGAYKGQAKQVVRTAMLDTKAQRVTIRDTISGATKPVHWLMHTKAKITLAGPRAILRIHDKQMCARIVSPAGVKFASRLDKDDFTGTTYGRQQATKPFHGEQCLYFVAPAGTKEIKVVFEPITK
jgi:hypothetical protein